MEAGRDCQAGWQGFKRMEQTKRKNQRHHYHTSPRRILSLRDRRYLGSDNPAAGKGRLEVVGMPEGEGMERRDEGEGAVGS